MSVDTLSLAKELRAADFASPQAEAIAAAIGRSVMETSATKADVTQLGTELRGEINQLGTELRGEINQLSAELRGEINQLGTELRGEIGRLGSDLRIEIERSRNSLLMWFVGIQIALGGIIVAVIKLVPAQGT